MSETRTVKFETRPFIDGDYRASASREVFVTENPATGAELAIFPDNDARDVDRAVSAARASFLAGWRTLAPDRRKAILGNVAAAVREARNALAERECLEMGMPVTQSLAAADAAADFLQYYAELADKSHGEVAPADPAHILAISCREPRGVVGVISPWNFPLLTAISAIAPALAAGNTVVAKPSEGAPSSVLMLAEIAHQAGLPAGVLNVVPGRGPSAGAALARHMNVDMIHFTGSSVAGRRMMIHSGESNAKPVMVEAGGKSPQIVFDDAADLEGLGASLAHAAFYNTGQLCVARTRLIVHQSVQARVLDTIREQTAQRFRIGDPLDASVSFGPIASREQLQRVRGYLQLAGTEGAEAVPLETSGVAPGAGYFQKPVLIVKARNEMRIAQEEIFGPVMTVLSFATEAEALQLANDVSYGLAATVWTQDIGRARRFARDLTAGRIDIRTCAAPGAPLEVLAGEPFGASGHGVLGGVRGLDPYTRLKAIQLITP